MAISPMMRQYLELKEEHKEQILFFRLGDFYEMFFDDALLAARELELTLTGRDCGLDEKAPMCGVPHHSAETYIARLIRKGYKVAIAEQMEEAGKGVKLVSREVVRIITPGTVIESSMLDEGDNNYVCAVISNENAFAIAFLDISTGELSVVEKKTAALGMDIKNELSRFSPREILASKEVLNLREIMAYIHSKMPIATGILSDEDMALQKNEETVLKHFKKQNLSDLSLEGKPLSLKVIGSALSYLDKIGGQASGRVLSISQYNDDAFMNMDEAARRNLEIIKTMHTGEHKGSLLWVLDKTKTAMGKRLLKNICLKPLLRPEEINRRLNAVEELYKNPMNLDEIREALSDVYDLERLMTRVVYGSILPRELKSLAYTCHKLPDIKRLLSGFISEELSFIGQNLDTLADLAILIEAALLDDPPATLKDGGVMRDGYYRELDELRDIMKNSRGFLADIEAREKEKTDISNLKIGYNRVFGYYLEVTNSHKAKVPPDYIRKQTLTGAERYVTEELKILEEKILTATDKIIGIETKLYAELRANVATKLGRVSKTADFIASIDVRASFAKIALIENFVKPEINDSGKILIKAGRHPVVEKMLPNEPFVSNDTNLDEDENRLMLITGPNMSGKSTYMRQVAIICLMAQMGSFVPASEANIGVVDSIFTRIGASDDLSSGRSTFMMEMSELSDILKNASKNSLIILDEIGRGTSTYDGMSIARAVLEYISNKDKLGAKTLFATHYHELTALETEGSGIKNYNIAVKKIGDDISFMRRIVRGPADDSYGIEVSKLAGIPEEIITRSKEVLEALEAGVPLNSDNPKPVKDKKLSEHELDIIDKLQKIDVEVLSPLEALKLIYELKNKLD